MNFDDLNGLTEADIINAYFELTDGSSAGMQAGCCMHYDRRCRPKELNEVSNIGCVYWYAQSCDRSTGRCR